MSSGLAVKISEGKNSKVGAATVVEAATGAGLTADFCFSTQVTPPAMMITKITIKIIRRRMRLDIFN
jgi:hypothetical protein